MGWLLLACILIICIPNLVIMDTKKFSILEKISIYVLIFLCSMSSSYCFYRYTKEIQTKAIEAYIEGNVEMVKIIKDGNVVDIQYIIKNNIDVD